MNIAIRTMTLNDVAAVCKLVADCNTFLAERQGFSSRQLQSLIAERCSEEWIRQTTAIGETYVAVSEGKIVGLAGIEGNDLAELWVTPSMHHNGIGAQLFSKVEGILLQRGHRKLTVHTTGYAIPFYEAMGARVVGRKPCDGGPLVGWPLTYLEKELKIEANQASEAIGA